LERWARIKVAAATGYEWELRFRSKQRQTFSVRERFWNGELSPGRDRQTEENIGQLPAPTAEVN
jgi:hypothetical protein